MNYLYLWNKFPKRNKMIITTKNNWLRGILKTLLFAAAIHRASDDPVHACFQVDDDLLSQSGRFLKISTV